MLEIVESHGLFSNANLGNFSKMQGKRHLLGEKTIPQRSCIIVLKTKPEKNLSGFRKAVHKKTAVIWLQNETILSFAP